jgi:hypothetical protein
MRRRGHHQHDEVGAAHRLGEVGGHGFDWQEPLVRAPHRDASLRTERRKPRWIAGMEPDLVATGAEIGRRRAAAVSGAKHRDCRDGHEWAL